MRRSVRLVVAAMVLMLVGAGAGWLIAAGAGEEPTPPEPRPRHTATVGRHTLIETEQVDATLSHGAVTPLINLLSGTLTGSVEVGTVTERGSVLYSVDMRPVVALVGEVPAYRTLAEGTAGVDVAQLEENLAALGYGGFVVDDTFTHATAGAVRQWQRDLGAPDSGAVEFGTIHFLRHSVRIASVAVRKGAPVGRGEPVIGYTDVDRMVVAAIDADQAALAHRAGTVRVSLAPGADAEGRIVRVTPDESPLSEDAQRTQAGAGDRFSLVIQVDRQSTAGVRDGASVTVTLAGRRRDGVLAVPVIALLALREGGYGVELVEEATTRVVAVTTGLFARGMVEVSGDQLREGMIVATAAP